MSLNEVLERGQSQTSLGWKGDHNREKWKLWVPIMAGDQTREWKNSHWSKIQVWRPNWAWAEPEVSNDPGYSDSPPTVPEELMHLFQSEKYESDDSSVSAVPPLLLL